MMNMTRRALIQQGTMAGAAGIATAAAVPAVASETQAGKRKQILLQIYFKVSKERAASFEKMYAETYAPALRQQRGYIRSNLLRLFPQDVAREIEAASTEFNYQMELVFDTEKNRRRWVESKEHAEAWPLASGMAEKFAWRGFDVVAEDQPTESA